VRYRYYVSQAPLQSKLQGAGSIGRMPAAEIEALVLRSAAILRKYAGFTPPGIVSGERLSP
jgi:hypothetical protein